MHAPQLPVRHLRPAESNGGWAAANKRLARKADLSAHGMAQPWFVPCRAPDRRRGASLVVGDGRLFDVERALHSSAEQYCTSVQSAGR